MPYTNDDAYTEGWNDAMKEMKGEIDELKYEAEGFKNLVGQRVPADGVVCQLRNNLRLIGNRLGGISGVERLNSVVKVPEYTKEIFEKIDELKKENAELQQERQQKRDGDDQWRKDSIIYHKLATSYEKDIVKLKDEIAGLKELLEQYDKSRDAWMIKCDERHGEIVELKELNDLKDLTITQLQKENEKLTTELIKTKPDMEIMDGLIIHLSNEEIDEDSDDEDENCYGECMHCDCKLYNGEGEYCNNGSCDLCEDCYEKHYAKCEDCKKEDEEEEEGDE
tara:strand:+ start:7519 stop:8358 length:840 start_codon:yes stop_codon:yes gene_type:complete